MAETEQKQEKILLDIKDKPKKKKKRNIKKMKKVISKKIKTPKVKK